MPIRDFECTACGKGQERVFNQTKLEVVVGRDCELSREQTDPIYPACEDCGGTLTVLPLSQVTRTYVGSVFPFVTNHISHDGKPMVIESMGHLRSVERQYGVVLPAFSKSNIRDVDPIKDPPRYRGWDPDFRK